MNNHDYQNLPGVSSHWLIEMLNSPAACYRKYLDPQRSTQEPTDAMRLGTLVHCLALTPEQFAQSFIVADYERRSVAGKARYAQLSETGLIPIKRSELDQALAVVDALHAKPAVRKLLQYGKKERTIIQPRQRGLLPLKARIDLHYEAKRQVVELKTTWNLTATQTTMERYHYPLSAAFYQKLVSGQSVVFVFMQTTPPHKVEVIPMERPQLQAGREQWQTVLARFDACWQANEWPEAEPGAAALDDDPLWLNFPPVKAATQTRFALPVGELEL